MLRLRLFGKIFLGFWLATVAVLVSWMLSSHYIDLGPSRSALEPGKQGPPHRFVLRTIYELQNLPSSELQELIALADTDHQVDIYLLDARSNEVMGRNAPSAALELASELKEGRRRAVDRKGGRFYLAHKIYRPEQGELRAVFVFKASKHQFLGLLRSNLWLRLALAILVSGAVCYLLSLILTRRVKALQQASRRLATGDLDARLKVRDKGGDETDELARDFNSMAAQLQERLQAQKRLLSDVSHELRSPLARLHIALALAQENPEKQTEHLDRIDREAQRLEELIAQLLALQTDGVDLDTHIDLVALLRDLCADVTFEGSASDKRCTFTHNLQEAVVVSSGDLLRKCFENILRNALHHTPPNTQVTVELRGSGNGFQVSIRDQGSGVDDAELSRIFDAFYRTDTARTRETGGYGLGLSIARRSVIHHGGSIAAKNVQPGLAVTIDLPAARELG